MRKKNEPAEELKLAPFMRLLKALHSLGTPESFTPEDLERQRKSQEALGSMAASMSGLVWEQFPLDDMNAAWMRLEREHKSRRVILYCHGGGYTSGGLGFSKVLASKLTRATGMDVLAFDYRLAPEHPYPAAIEDGLRAWDYLMRLGFGARDVILAGDSAGGNLALVLCLKLRLDGRMLPGAILLMSPWTDMTMTSQSLTERAAIDPALTPEYIRAVREAYAGGLDPAQPGLSPLFADFRGFPPTLIQVGTHEILYSDSEQLAGRMKAQGIDCRLEVWENMWHDFQMYPSKSASSAMQNIAHFLLETL